MSLRHLSLACALLGAIPPAAHGEGTLHFTDAAELAGVRVRHESAGNQQIGGATVGDFNRDGWQDLFVLTGGDAPDRLFINNGDGTFTDRAAEWGVDATHIGVGASVGDYDRDGWLDIYVTSFGVGGGVGHHRLYRNNAGHSFTDVANAAGVSMTSEVVPDGWGSGWGDYDLDGDLDLFVTGWALHSNGNKLFRNNGDGTFSDVTAGAIQFDLLNTYGFAPAFADMNGDRFPEILLAADYGTSRYFINNRDGTFTEHTAASGLGIDSNGMGQAIGDFNNDGLLDWYVSSIYLVPTKPGNTLYMNQGNDAFLELGAAAGVNQAGWGWGTTAADFDHNGWQDLIATNGWPGRFGTDPTRLYLNNGDLTFTERAVALGIDHTGHGRALLNFDFDNDGDQDVYLLTYDTYPNLYRNDLAPAPDAAWLEVFLNHGGRRNLAPDGFGAIVRVTAGGTTRSRPVGASASYLGTCEISAHFGLAAATIVDELRVEWPTGEVSILADIAINQRLTITATRLAGDVTLDGRVDLSDLGVLLSAYPQCAGGGGYVVEADLDESGCIDLTDLMNLLAHFGEALF